MGIMISGLKIIKPAYDFCLQAAYRVNTRNLQVDMEHFVKNCFWALKPLSHEYKEVCEINPEGVKLCVGEWLREKNSYQTYGSNLESSRDVYQIIKNYGDEIKPHVRKPIKEEFAMLVDYTKQLVSYDDILVTVNIPKTELFEYHFPRFTDNKAVAITSMVVNSIGIRTRRSHELILFYQKKGESLTEERGIFDVPNAVLFEDVITYMVELYKKADAEVSKVREHNEKIMSQMKEILTPWSVANNLKS